MAIKYYAEDENPALQERPFERVFSGILKFMLFLMLLGLVVLIGGTGVMVALLFLSIR